MRIGITVDLDKLKCIQMKEHGKCILDDLELQPLAKRLNPQEIELNGEKYETFLIFFSEMYHDEKFKEQIKHLFQYLAHRKICIRLAGNGLELNKKVLNEIMEENYKAGSVKKCSQVKGITEGLRLLAKSGISNFYGIKGQSLLDFKGVKYSSDIEKAGNLIFPTLVISIKGGVSFYMVQSMDTMNPKKVIASIFGEFALAGIIKLMNSEPKHESVGKMIRRAWEKGSNLKVDLTVGDIYGDGVQQVAGLHKDIIASSMGKSVSQLHDTTDSDYIFSAVVMFGINIGSIGSLVVR